MTATIVLFDLGDVIADWDPGPRMAEYSRRSGLSPSEVRDRLSTGNFWADTDRGLYTATQMHEQICELLGCNFTLPELLRLEAGSFTIRPEVLSIAESAAARVTVGILTNNTPLLCEAFPDHFPELLRLFEPILFSYQFGHVKPEPALFERAQSRLNVRPDEILFTDDKAGHVVTAKSSGWDAVRYESPTQLRGFFIERGIIDRSG